MLADVFSLGRRYLKTRSVVYRARGAIDGMTKSGTLDFLCPVLVSHKNPTLPQYFFYAQHFPQL